jgi:hypothetical protein
MSVIEAVQMVEICLERVSPASQDSRKTRITPLKSSGADHRKFYCPQVHKDIDPLSYSGEHASRPGLPITTLVFCGNNANS